MSRNSSDKRGDRNEHIDYTRKFEIDVANVILRHCKPLSTTPHSLPT